MEKEGERVANTNARVVLRMGAPRVVFTERANLSMPQCRDANFSMPQCGNDLFELQKTSLA